LLQALADATATASENLHLYETLAARARERTAELEPLAHAVSHDLPTPITHAGAYASRLMDEEGARLAPEARQKLEIVIDAVGQLGRMVAALLELSQTGRGAR